MKSTLVDLQPGLVWKWFAEILQVPRPSGHESGMSDLMIEFAEERGLESSRDHLGNVRIARPGTGDLEDAPPVALQAHMDMVGEKTPHSDHDFQRDAIDAEVDGDWVVARETTLGADNGIGVALILALLDSTDLRLPPLECLLTVQEEVGLIGAAELDPDWISSDRLINLDSEKEGIFCVGCAGGIDISVDLDLETSGESEELWTVSVDGLKGGHSGIEIDKDRANAIHLLARSLNSLFDLGCGLASLEGGSKRNAIPRNAIALITIPSGRLTEVESCLGTLSHGLTAEYERIEENLSISLSSAPGRSKLLSRDSQRRLIDLLLCLPHGVVKMSWVVKDLVETSVNLASVLTEDRRAVINLSARSSVESAKQGIVEMIESVGRLSGAAVNTRGSYPGWRPRWRSPLVQRSVEVYREINGREPSVVAIHAGLECGMLASKKPDLDMISMGPEVRNVHAPGEKIGIASVERFWRFLCALLSDMGTNPDRRIRNG